MAKGIKTGGRTKGVANKRTQELAELLSNKFKGYNPILSLAEIAHDSAVPIEIRLSAHKEVASYIFAKRKAIEVDMKQALHISAPVAFELPDGTKFLT